MSLNRFNRAPHLIDSLDVLPGEPLDLIGERLDEVRTSEGVRRFGDTRFVADDLLRAKREASRIFGRQRKCLIEAVGVKRLRAAHHRRHRLHRNSHHVVDRLLRRQR